MPRRTRGWHGQPEGDPPLQGLCYSTRLIRNLSEQTNREACRVSYYLLYMAAAAAPLSGTAPLPE